MDITLSEEIHGHPPIATQYLDDTCVHTIDWKGHLSALDKILTKLAAINLKLCPTKCVFGANKAEHLGHIVRKNELLPDPAKVKAVSTWITPINISERSWGWSATTATSSQTSPGLPSPCTR
jgi:hypothetical protein